MEFHKKKGAIFVLGLVVTVLGGLGTALLVGWFFQGGRLPVFLFLAPVAMLAGLGVGAYAMLPFRMRIDAHGITTRHPPEGLNTFVPWSHIAAVTIERKPEDGQDKAPYVVLWPVPGADLGAEPGFHRDVRPAYLLGQLDEIKEPEEQVRDALAHCAGPRFGGASAQPQQGYQQPMQQPGYPPPGHPQQGYQQPLRQAGHPWPQPGQPPYGQPVPHHPPHPRQPYPGYPGC